MAENNKFIVKIIDHDNNNSILQELSYQTRERAEEFKRISDRAYGKLLGCSVSPRNRKKLLPLAA